MMSPVLVGLGTILLFFWSPPGGSQGSETNEAIAGPIAVEWRGAEPVDPDLRADLRQAIASVDGRPPAAVSDQAVRRARVAVSRELPATVRDRARALRERLDLAHEDYLAGRYAAARAALAEARVEVDAHPELPGAAASAREAALLEALVGRALGDEALVDAGLSAALRLDPQAQLSSRRAPPVIVERYASLQQALLEARARGEWSEADAALAEAVASQAIEVEIDGVAGLRPVPPGEHFVLVLREGHVPVAELRELDAPWTPVDSPERVLAKDPEGLGEFEGLCEILELSLLVVAEQRDGRVGLQGYRCGQGFGARWIGARVQLGEGAEAVLGGPFEEGEASLGEVWPSPVAAVIEVPAPVVPDQPQEPRPWYRKGWIWGAGVGAAALIAGGIAAGVLLGGAGRSGPPVEIDAGDFL
ncbi:hypothetical protein G6O69_29475 [Pseudenhygromyxa sp. WMMC2535]|uniref:hypothetical protein n=1 Tax=Pseudenhygromyxa sp. WMMC2535 TaxID=2712867 RepID=UPI0015527A39|nr:hypothetical protein [Pseudenhygromyxa sp. WMMC2535]NVB41994.1 hypothetical protein [Pseudenhygromyxa sp. WMMC2535]